MRLAYLDCGSGISGNMFLGALIELGLPLNVLQTELRTLPITLPEITFKKVDKKGISATLMEVEEFHEHQHRHLADLKKIINDSKLTPGIKQNAIACFANLAAAEAKVHGVSVEAIHFHEVGAVDAIIDIVGACIGVDFLKIDRVMVSPVRVGFGTVNCAHGEIRLPAPATVELLAGLEIYGGELEGEWTTPTGATLIKTFAAEQGPLPLFRVEKAGYGAGNADRAIPNALRIITGEVAGAVEHDYPVVIETNIDDMNPEIYGSLGELLLTNGARDYYLTPVQMKKNRPGILLTVIAPVAEVPRLEKIILDETTTFGVRSYRVERSCLRRGEFQVKMEDNRVRIKTAYQNEEICKFAPEYEDCRLIAQKTGQTLRKVYERAQFEAQKIIADNKGTDRDLIE